jgi:hypothetical protein
MLAVIITACTLSLPGPIDPINPIELKNGQCREFMEKFNPEYSTYGEAANPIIIDKSHQDVTPQECMKYGEMAMKKWKESHPNLYINKWHCDAKAIDKDEI